MSTIELIYVEAGGQVWREIQTIQGECTVEQVIVRSSFFDTFAHYAPAQLAVGIYGRLCSMDHLVRPGDRIEIYRPLRFDPMESRRRRARHRARQR